jgi:hypothetical protein
MEEQWKKLKAVEYLLYYAIEGQLSWWWSWSGVAVATRMMQPPKRQGLMLNARVRNNATNNKQHIYIILPGAGCCCSCCPSLQLLCHPRMVFHRLVIVTAHCCTQAILVLVLMIWIHTATNKDEESSTTVDFKPQELQATTWGFKLRMHQGMIIFKDVTN